MIDDILGTTEASEQEIANILASLNEKLDNFKLYTYKPYEYQSKVHAAGKDHQERMICAGNRVGKTFSGAMETAYHATGLYPDWWEGPSVILGRAPVP